MLHQLLSPAARRSRYGALSLFVVLSLLPLVLEARRARRPRGTDPEPAPARRPGEPPRDRRPGAEPERVGG